MSMPTFPENGINLTKEQAFHMLLGSIAMEELALSHIMNAEGEKLQYILGTLPGGQNSCACPTPQEVLEVNRSITELLEQVTQSQLLLKNKLTQVLKAMEGSESCPPEPHKPSCLSCGEARICALTLPKPLSIQGGDCIPWKPTSCSEEMICWNKTIPSNIYLVTHKSILLNYSFQIKTAEAEPVILVLQVLKNNCWENILRCEGSSEPDLAAFLSGTAVIHSEGGALSSSPLRFVLQSSCCVSVKQAALTLVEI